MALYSVGRVFADLSQVGRSITRTLATGRTLLSSQQQQQQQQQSGGDKYVEIVETRGRSSDGEDHHRSVFEMCAQLMKAIDKSPVPVIAAVDGLAAAAGCQLVAACDIVVCTERSSFSTPGANFGIFCSTPGIPLIRNVPRKVAAHMLFTGLPISAQEAYLAGLVSKVVPTDMLEEEVKKITDAINEKSRSVVRLGKRFIREQVEVDADTAYSLGTEIMVNNLKLKDAQEGIKSFSEKRRPSWTHGYEKDS
ncbi:enoyl-CoA hydratase domain-containing protein 3, mitochondrial isoform X2 [Nasonia vitripennis]|uniref:Enoyl-CoA hydratase domain-containing protein 3, mitochondrial n=1 Tax=Nasonia vitripennis TaxID=7425 RepID=A0A7M7IWK3_NASVI|nr:enoyl-CoA hydratase domain-containing protein 3, mitochondrial isoform X2 [Nasonia vitripennis]